MSSLRAGAFRFHVPTSNIIRSAVQREAALELQTRALHTRTKNGNRRPRRDIVIKRLPPLEIGENVSSVINKALTVVVFIGYFWLLSIPSRNDPRVSASGTTTSN